MDDRETRPGVIRVGLAHGAVQGFGSAGDAGVLIVESHGVDMQAIQAPGKRIQLIQAFGQLKPRAGFEDVKLIIPTHGHWDHIGSAHAIKELTGAPIAMNSHETASNATPIRAIKAFIDQCVPSHLRLSAPLAWNRIRRRSGRLAVGFGCRLWPLVPDHVVMSS